MSNRLKYKGYTATIQYSIEDHVLYGKIEDINDLVNFESESAAEIENEFHAAVDDYISFCERVGKHPEKSYSGCFNVRVAPQLHRRLARMAADEGKPLNQVVEDALCQYVSPPREQTVLLDGMNGFWGTRSTSVDLLKGAVLQTFNYPESNIQITSASWAGKGVNHV